MARFNAGCECTHTMSLQDVCRVLATTLHRDLCVTCLLKAGRCMQVSFRGWDSSFLELLAVVYSAFVWPFAFFGLDFVALVMVLLQGKCLHNLRILLSPIMYHEPIITSSDPTPQH